MVNRFIARHGAEALTVALEKVDEFLSDQRLTSLDNVLELAPVVGDLLVRSRRNLRNALEGIAEGESVWMILTHEPGKSTKRRECIEVRSVIGHSGPIRVSFEDTLGGGGRP